MNLYKNKDIDKKILTAKPVCMKFMAIFILYTYLCKI